MQAIEDAEDALLERGATNNAIVDNDQIVYTWLETLVGDVVDVGSKVVARAVLSDEGAQLDVLPRHFLGSHVLVED